MGELFSLIRMFLVEEIKQYTKAKGRHNLENNLIVFSIAVVK